MLTKIATLLVIGFTLTFISCNKDNDVIEPTVNVELDDELYTSEIFDEVVEISDEAMDLYETQALKTTTGPERYSRLSDCVTITKVITDSVKTTTIDFGEINCLCNDGRERRGKIIVVHEGSYWDANALITITFEDFYVDDNQVLGLKTIVQSINAENQRVNTITVDGSLILADGTGTITWTADRVRTVVEGSETHTKKDDITETTGNSECVMTDGASVVSTIVTPLVRKHEVGCMMYIVKGIREIQKTGESLISIDYGDGTCDNYADVTQDGVTETIELKRKRPHRF